MIFKDDNHKKAFYHLIDKMQLNHSDPERVALAYLLSLNEDCRSHIKDLYEFEERAILTEGLNKEWQTHTSIKTTRLAFNLYNGYSYDEQEETSEYYTPVHLFACSYAPYFWEAIKIRYPEYTEE